MPQSPANSARFERWKREDDAPRLAQEVPGLLHLRLELSEIYNGRNVLDCDRIQHVIVARAAARFEVPCSDARCEDGGHDLTHEVMRNLRQSRASFTGQDQCSGYVGERPCARVLRFSARAEFSQNG